MSSNAFQEFVNEELPKRISTEDLSTAVAENLIPVSTGVGLGVTFKSINDLGLDVSSGISIITVKDLPVNSYQVEMPTGYQVKNIIKPIMVNVGNDTFVEVLDFSEVDNKIILDPNDFEDLELTVTTVSFKYAVVKDEQKLSTVNLFIQDIPSDGLIELDKPIYNGLILSNIIIHLEDNSIVDLFESTELMVDRNILDFSEVFNELTHLNIVGISLSYITDVP